MTCALCDLGVPPKTSSSGALWFEGACVARRDKPAKIAIFGWVVLQVLGGRRRDRRIPGSRIVWPLLRLILVDSSSMLLIMETTISL